MVVAMDDEKFRLLVHIIQIMEDHDIKHMDLGTSIVGIINKLDSSLSESQKLKIKREFSKYEKMRRQIETNKKEKQDEERYKEELQRFEGSGFGLESRGDG